ncbi:hypothetical protein [Fischerella thermalis]|uniref:hypothetical protein n=1 Tax=Fischerella thermalis TaxID=372787 RepID=UPI0011C08124|nr:hypothetical protein [Fischerella thermalis]
MGDRCAYGGWEEVLKIEHRCTPIHADGRSLCIWWLGRGSENRTQMHTDTHRWAIAVCHSGIFYYWRLTSE